MKTYSLGLSEVKVTPIIMGTWQAGKIMWADIDDTESKKAVRTAFEQGITTFDTAEVYGNGHSERIVAASLTDVRDQVVYASKVFVNHLKYDQVITACNRSLKNLKTDYIDIYQIHWPSGSFGSEYVPIGETMEAMNSLKERKKILAIGVSNFSRKQIEEASEYGRIDSLQPPYSLFWRHVEDDAMKYCIENRIKILAYSPLAQGFLTGKFGPDHKFSKGDHRSQSKLFKTENYQRVQDALKKLQPIAKKYDITLGQLALAWVISHSETCAIAGARNADQVRQNVKAAEISISPDDLIKIDKISRMVTDPLDKNPVLWDF